MDNTTHTIRIGTRNSRLAMIQTGMVADSLRAAAPGTQVLLEARLTTGDKILNKPLQEFGGKGVFVSEFEEGILEGRLDLAVHSAKDMPMELAAGLSIVGVPRREDPRDVLVTAAGRPVPETGEIVIGTSSPRRKLQIELLGTELWPGGSVRCENLRGNVQTRLGKLESGMYHGIILAAAGLKRLGLLEDPRYNFQFLECESFIPAGGQGILAVEGRADSRAAGILSGISHRETWLCLNLERQVLKLLDAGCHEPIGVYSRLEGGLLEVFGISGRNGRVYKIHLKGQPEEAGELARRAAEGLGGA
ncbi:hydroxymethylbilane synthase [Enterocloster lavalensis]|uniref:hydroxymethylbilane synthase n=1 Tax=Enterocloster lavalensis TaxID=460384 RepID=UPI002A81A9DC|nr:hydroxymethylbilane synthase [Enterocloster lavalensis]